eukprot:scaffold7627_cov189-Skeletonema_marinoi.AAC.3
MKFNMRRNQQQHDVPPRRVRKDRSLLDEPRINEISDQLLKIEIRDVVISTAHSLKAAASFKTTAFHELGQEIGEELTEFQLSTTKSFYDLKEHLEDHFTVVNETETAMPSLFHNDTDKVCDARDDDMSLTDGRESRFDAEDTVEQNSLDTDDDDTAFVSVDLSKKSTGVDASTIAGDLTETDADESTTPTVEDDGEKQAMENLTGTFSAFSQCLGEINCADINCADITFGTGLFDDDNNHNNHTENHSNHDNNTKNNNYDQNNKVHDDDTASVLVDKTIDWSKIVKRASTERMYAPKACEKKEKKWKKMKMKIFRRRRK